MRNRTRTPAGAPPVVDPLADRGPGGDVEMHPRSWDDGQRGHLAVPAQPVVIVIADEQRMARVGQGRIHRLIDGGT